MIDLINLRAEGVNGIQAPSKIFASPLNESYNDLKQNDISEYKVAIYCTW